MKHVTIVAGARPNFMKIAPIIKEINHQKIKNGCEIDFALVHTGQHYDKKMSGNFFKELNIPKPNINLESGGGTQSEQTGNIMIRFEKYLKDFKTDLVLVVGDVNSTMACSITAKKMNIKVAHVEAGIRSNDWSMPEEINRIVTDSISDYFFTTSEIASNNLVNNGIESNRIFFVGNTMVDTLLSNLENLKKPVAWDIFKLNKRRFFVLTLHRPANVDDQKSLIKMLEKINSLSKNLPVIFPVHPRTRSSLKTFINNKTNIKFIDPLSYLEFNYLVKNSFAVITDSGGITEEATVMGVPCITLRNNTERPETINIGTNVLAGTDPEKLDLIFENLFQNKWKKGGVPKFWDGKSASRIVKKIIEL